MNEPLDLTKPNAENISDKNKSDDPNAENIDPPNANEHEDLDSDDPNAENIDPNVSFLK